ncbi:MAG: signal peptidase I [bacterium]|nr:signal peptidase I [bacterium]
MFGLKKRNRGGQVRPPARKRHVVVEYIRSIGSALLIALVLRQFIFQAFRIPTGSMLETLQIGDFLFVNKFLYGAKSPDRIRIPLVNWTLIDGLPVLKLPALREPRQGDIIVFEYPRDRNLDYIKRCVAVAGDSVAVREGVLYVNGKVFESNLGQYGGDHSCIPDGNDPESCPPPRAKKEQASYVRNARNHSFPWEGLPNPYVVPAGHIFMMGDNRYNSMDSRYWGPLDTKLIKGKALFIYWSWDNERHLPRFSRLGDAIR